MASGNEFVARTLREEEDDELEISDDNTEGDNI
jgi:hypothetical protein